MHSSLLELADHDLRLLLPEQLLPGGHGPVVLVAASFASTLGEHRQVERVVRNTPLFGDPGDADLVIAVLFLETPLARRLVLTLLGPTEEAHARSCLGLMVAREAIFARCHPRRGAICNVVYLYLPAFKLEHHPRVQAGLTALLRLGRGLLVLARGRNIRRTNVVSLRHLLGEALQIQLLVLQRLLKWLAHGLGLIQLLLIRVV